MGTESSFLSRFSSTTAFRSKISGRLPNFVKASEIKFRASWKASMDKKKSISSISASNSSRLISFSGSFSSSATTSSSSRILEGNSSSSSARSWVGGGNSSVTSLGSSTGRISSSGSDTFSGSEGMGGGNCSDLGATFLSRAVEASSSNWETRSSATFLGLAFFLLLLDAGLAFFSAASSSGRSSSGGVVLGALRSGRISVSSICSLKSLSPSPMASTSISSSRSLWL